MADAGAGTTHDGVRFGRVPATVGSRWSVSTRATSKTDDGDQLSGYESDYTVEVLAVERDVPSRVRLHFARNVSTYHQAETENAIHAKTYVVDVKAPNVRDQADAAVSESESERVLDAFPDIGTRARVDEVLPEDAMTVGDRRDELAEAVVRILHPRAWKLVSGKAALARVENGDALFDLTIVAESRSKGVKMEVSGAAHVRLRDARLTDLALDGSYDDGAGTSKGAFSVRRVVRDL